MGNKERKLEFIDSYDEDDSFDGDFSKLKAISLTTSQLDLVNKILLREKVKLTSIWAMYTVLITIMLFYGSIENFLQIILIMFLFMGDVIGLINIVKKWMKDKCKIDSKAYEGKVTNKFYFHNKSERKYFVSIKFPNNKVIYKVNLNKLVKEYINIGDSVLIIPLMSIVVIPVERNKLL